MPQYPYLSPKPSAVDPNTVKLTGDQTIEGVKTFDSIPVLPGINPSSDNQAARKAYVDAVALGLTIKDSVAAATTANITLSGTQTVDGYAVQVGDRVLVKNQSTGSQNGIYVAASGAWSRSGDADSTPDEVKPGIFTSVLNGSTNGNTQWVLTTPTPISLGSTTLTFSRLSQPTSYTGGDGIAVAGTDIAADLKTNDGLAIKTAQIGVDYDDSTIGIVSNKLAVKDSGITNAKLAGSIADSKLSTIATTNKVNWAAVNKTGSRLVDIADLNISGITDGQLLRWDATTSKWVAVDPGAVGATSQFLYGEQVVHAAGATALAFTNAAAALTTITANTRKKVDLSGAIQFRLVVTQSVAGFAGTKLRAQYSTNNSTFNQMDSDTSGDLDIGTGTGVKVGAWTNLVAGAKADVWVQLYTIGGDAVADPAFTEIYVQYKFNASIISGTSSSVISKDHAIVATPMTVQTWTSMPAAVTELFGNTFGRIKVNLAEATQYRIYVDQSVAGFAGADINLQYSLDGTNFLAADSAAAGELDVGTGTGVKYGAFANLVSGAKGDVWLRLVGKDGNGTVSPGFRQIHIEFKGVVTWAAIGSTTQVTFNDAGTMAGNAGLVFDKTTGKLTTTLLKMTGGTPGVGKVLTSDADGDASWGDVPSSVAGLDDLDDVDLATTPPTNGQYLGFDDVPSYAVSLSPLNWGGNDYKAPNFGGSVDPSVNVIWAGNAQFVETNPSTISIDELGAQNVHVALVNIGGTRSTMYLCDNIAGTGPDLEAILQAQVDPSTTVDNFKANYFTYHAGANFTFNGLTGFEEAGTVTVVSGLTTPPTFNFVVSEQQWIPKTLATNKVFAMGIDRDSQGPPSYQTIADSTPTVLNMPDSLDQLTGWHGDNSPGSITVEGPGGDAAIGAIFTVNVYDDSDNPIPTMLVEIQESLPGDQWRTIGAGYAGSATAAVDFDAGTNTKGWRVRVSHTEGSPVDVAHRFQVSYTPTV